MLPSKDLAPTYDKAVWVYVYRTFKKDEADRAAERISLRFGVTSWPQMFLADPETFEILKHTGRSVASFVKAMSSVQVPRHETSAAHGALLRAEKAAIALETKPKKKEALKALDDADIVVRTRALEFVAKEQPEAVVKRAVELLAVPNDPFRYTVCEVLWKAADPKAAEALEALVRDPKDSLNPNVLRMRAVRALSTCGGLDSVAAIAPHAQSGAYFNGLTGASVDALRDIAARDKKARKAARTALIGSYPEPVAETASARERRACEALARRVHKALGSKMSFPKPYDAAARARLLQQKP